MGRAAYMTRSGLSPGSATCRPATSRTGTTLPHKACRENRQAPCRSSPGKRHRPPAVTAKPETAATCRKQIGGKHINDIAATVFPRRHSSLRPSSCGRTGRRTRTAGKCPSTRKPERRTTAGLLTSSDRDTFPTSTNVSGRIARTCNGSYSYGDSP